MHSLSYTHTRTHTHTHTHTHPLSIQLGGKNAGIVFADADLDQCLPTTIKSAFVNQGEVCLTTSRVYVEEGLYDAFVERYVALARCEGEEGRV